MRFLIIEDSTDDELLLLGYLRRERFEVDHLRVETAEAMADALRSSSWDVILADHWLPRFSAPEALELLRESGMDIPFIVVSGTNGEDSAVEMIHAGANDYLLKQNLTRLASSIRRELSQAAHRSAERAARLELERSERKFRTVVEQASDLIALSDAAGNFLDANRVALETFGYSGEEIRSLRFADLIPAEDLDREPIRYDELAAGQTTRTVRRLRRKDGSMFSAEISAKILPDEQILMMARDVTERMRAHQELERRSRQQTAVAELGAIALGCRDLSELFRTTCRVTAHTLDVEYAGIVRLTDDGSVVEMLAGYGFDPEIAERHRRTPVGTSQATQTLRARDPVVVDDWAAETRFVMPPIFREHECRSGISVVILGRDEPWGVLGAQSRTLHAFTSEDIAFMRSVANLLGEAIERSQSEEALRESEAMLARAQQIAHIANWTFNLAGDIDWSAEADRMFGRCAGDGKLTVDEFLTYVHPDDRGIVGEAIRGAIARREATVLEYRTWPRTGQPRTVLATTEPVLDDRGELLAFDGIVQDITDRRGTEELLLQREQEFRAIVETAPDVISRFDRQCRHVYVSPAVERVTGLKAEDCLGRTYRELGMSPAGCDLFEASIRHVFDTATEVQIDFTFPSPQGPRSFNGRLVPQLGKDGRPAFVLGVARDITDRRNAEQALRNSELRYRSLVEQSPDGIFTVDREGMVVSINSALLAAGGWADASAVIGHHYSDFIDPDDVPRAEKDLQAILRGEAVPASEFLLRTVDGRRLLIESRPSPAIEEGRIVGLFAIARDVTERRRAEKEREQLARNLELLLESTYEGICALDPNGNCTLMNTAAFEMLGYTRAEILGHPFHELIHARDGEDDDCCPAVRVLETRERQQTQDIVLRRRDRSTFPASMSAAPMVAGGILHGAVVLFSDLTQRRALEQELKRAEHLGALGQMAATVAHEFNNVLMAIQPFAEIVSRKTTDPKSTTAVMHILQAVQRGRRVTEEVLRFARRPEPVRRPIACNPFFAGIAADIEAVMPPEIHVSLRCGDENPVIDGDAEQLAQVLLNLAVNARDAISGLGTLTLEISAHASDAVCARIGDCSRYVHVLVSDTGSGIPKEALDRLFEPFFTTKRRGTGLGLPIAQQIILAHEGHVFVESIVGEGTDVHILLPRSDKAAIAEKQPGRRRKPDALAIGSVLVVDDEETIASGVCELLRSEGMRCVFACDGETGMKAAEAGRPDAVVLDVGLPDMPGTEVFLRLRARWPDLPIVFATGHADEEKLREYLSLPGVAFLRKPFTYDALDAALKQVTQRGAERTAMTR